MGIWFHPTRSAFSAPRVLSVRAVPQPKLWAALHGLPLLFRARSPGPRAVPPLARQVRRHFLSWTFSTLRHSLRPADPLTGGGSLRHRVPRAGFGYPLSGVHHRPSRRVKRTGASMGFTLPGLPLVTIGAPLGARALLALPAATAPPRRAASATWPASGPCSRDESVLSPEPQAVPAVDPCVGFDPPECAPVRPGARFDRGASPLALRRLYV
jgi:hypothetical protein